MSKKKVLTVIKTTLSNIGNSIDQSAIVRGIRNYLCTHRTITNQLARKKIYNPDSIELTKDRQIVGGDPTGMFELNDIKFQWAYNLWEVMLANTWFPQEANMSRDINDYASLSPSKKNSYDKVLAQLIFMDSLQTNNIIDNVNPYVTAPEINLILIRQAFEEALHSQSYAVMVDAISANADEIYELWRKDERLRTKNDKIAKVYQDLSVNPTASNFVKVAFANLILEGIYFYCGFAYIYALARNGTMLASAQMIRFIQRDEVTHLIIYQNIIRSFKRTSPELFTPELMEEIFGMFHEAVGLESDWGKYITEDDTLGFTDEIIENYVKSLADERLKSVGFEPLYNVTSKLTWVEGFAKLEDHKTNQFEGNVTNYSVGNIEIDDF